VSSARRIDFDNRSRSIERQIVALAEAHHAIIDRVQLLALGLHPSAIDRRVSSGRPAAAGCMC
jgi:hypothetical protein